MADVVDGKDGEVSIFPDTELSRRGFIGAAGLVAGGLVIGAVVPSGCARQEPAAPVVDTDMNAFVRVSSDGEVSIVVPGAELGQGVYTSLPKIVAEEMEAYRLYNVVPQLFDFREDLTNWYIRLNRSRF